MYVGICGCVCGGGGSAQLLPSGIARGVTHTKGVYIHIHVVHDRSVFLAVSKFITIQ